MIKVKNKFTLNYLRYLTEAKNSLCSYKFNEMRELQYTHEQQWKFSWRRHNLNQPLNTIKTSWNNNTLYSTMHSQIKLFKKCRFYIPVSSETRIIISFVDSIQLRLKAEMQTICCFSIWLLHWIKTPPRINIDCYLACLKLQKEVNFRFLTEIQY